MDEYIKREYAIDAVLDVYYDTPDIDLSGEKFEAAIRKIQVADVAPVRHGRWIGCNGEIVDWDENNPGCPRHSCFCSICKSWLTASDEFPVIAYFCPNCGTKMDGGNDG